MAKTKAELIGYRSELLAKLFLTGSPAVFVMPFSGGDLDFICSIYPSEDDKVQGFLNFGIAVWGTERELDEKTATRIANEKWSKKTGEGSKQMPIFYMPVVALLFSVHDDQGYYAWVTEPSVDDRIPKLSMPTQLQCFPVEKKSLEGIIKRVKAWYKAFNNLVLVDEKGRD